MEDTLAELEVDHLPMVVALNKVDLLPETADPMANLDIEQPTVCVSAKTGAGIDELLALIEAVMTQYLQPISVLLPYKRGDLVSLFYERGQVDHEEHTGDGVQLHGRLPERILPYFEPYTMPEEALPEVVDE